MFQSYMWRHIDVRADWRRSWTYGRAPDYEDVCLFLLLQSVVVAKTWIDCEYNAKALNLSMRLSQKHEVVAKAWIKHKVVAKAYMLSM